MESTKDWQQTICTSKERLQYLFETKKFSDCSFIVKNENEHEEISSHKLVLAMASPVFEAMFFGGIADKNKPITIIDIQSDDFKSILRYMYTEEIQLTSVEDSYNIFYAAKKYMLPFLMEQCLKFFISAVTPKNVVKLYEFSKFYEEKLLTNTCLDIMCTKTMEVLNDPAFEDANLNTILEIVDQDYLNIESELDLFNAVERYILKNKSRLSQPKVPESVATALDNNSASGSKTEKPPKKKSKTCLANDNQSNAMDVLPVTTTNKQDCNQVIKKIRYLTLSSEQFATGPGKSNLLTQEEILLIIMSISLGEKDCLMPEGFTQNRCKRNNKIVRTCVRTILKPNEFTQQSVSHCYLRFTTDRNVNIKGIQVYAQANPPVWNKKRTSSEIGTAPWESMYVCIIDFQENVIAYTHYSTRNIDKQKILTISFNEDVFIKRYDHYKLCVYFHKPGLFQVTKPDQNEIVKCEDVSFTFNYFHDSLHDSIIQGIIFYKTNNEF